MLYMFVSVLYKCSKDEWELRVGISHGRLPEGGEHGTDGKEEEGTRAWVEALKWDRDTQVGDGTDLPSSFLYRNQEIRNRLLEA